MTILVAGASGFIGRRVSLALARRAHTVLAIRYSQPPLVDYPTHLRWLRGDLRDQTFIQSFAGQVQAVIYCASRPTELRSERDRAAARLDGVKVVSDGLLSIPFFYCSSQKVVTEPASPYSDLQRQCEAIVAHRTPPGTIRRLPKLYGPGRQSYLKAVHWLFPHHLLHVEQATNEIIEWVSQIP